MLLVTLTDRINGFKELGLFSLTVFVCVHKASVIRDVSFIYSGNAEVVTLERKIDTRI